MEINDKGVIGEAFVNDLSFNSYLKYWCYPNPVDVNGDKKEICDLLILFENFAIIISVKNYDNKGNYERYKRKVIDNSSKQLYGAQRKLFNNDKDVIIKHPNKSSEIFNSNQYDKIYRITVNVGEQFEDYEFSDRRDGKEIINIFNKETFEIITRELDTISDLVEYLDEREKFLNQSSKLQFNCSESDLLAVFLKNGRKFPKEYHTDEFQEKSFDLKNAWKNYDDSAEVLLKRNQDRYSYFIDDLVRNNVLKEENGENMARILMSLNRIERRTLAKSIFGLVEKYQNTDHEIARRYSVQNGIGVLQIYYSENVDEKLVDETLKIAMPIYCYKNNFAQKEIIMIAVSDNFKQWKFGMYRQSEDKMSPSEINFYENLIDKLKWFKNTGTLIIEEKEYPTKK